MTLKYLRLTMRRWRHQRCPKVHVMQGKKSRRRLRNNILSGIAVTIPIVATGMLLVFLFDLVARLLHPVFGPIFERVGLTGRIPDVALAALAMMITMFALAALGVAVQTVIGNRIKRKWNELLSKLPIVGLLYGPIHELVDALTSSHGAFKGVVTFPYPAPPLEAIGFITGDWTSLDGVEMYRVYMPMALTPTEGLLLLVPVSVTRKLDMSVDEALKLVVSGGFVMPQK